MWPEHLLLGSIGKDLALLHSSSCGRQLLSCFHTPTARGECCKQRDGWFKQTGLRLSINNTEPLLNLLFFPFFFFFPPSIDGKKIICPTFLSLYLFSYIYIYIIFFYLFIYFYHYIVVTTELYLCCTLMVQSVPKKTTSPLLPLCTKEKGLIIKS